MGGKQFSTWIFLSWRKCFRSLFLTTEKILLLSDKNQEILQFEVKTYFFQIWRSHFWDSPWDSFSYDFFGKDILRKTPQLSEREKIRAKTPGVKAVEGVLNRMLCHSDFTVMNVKSLFRSSFDVTCYTYVIIIWFLSAEH